MSTVLIYPEVHDIFSVIHWNTLDAISRFPKSSRMGIEFPPKDTRAVRKDIYRPEFWKNRRYEDYLDNPVRRTASIEHIIGTADESRFHVTSLESDKIRARLNRAEKKNYANPLNKKIALIRLNEEREKFMANVIARKARTIQQPFIVVVGVAHIYSLLALLKEKKIQTKLITPGKSRPKVLRIISLYESYKKAILQKNERLIMDTGNRLNRELKTMSTHPVERVPIGLHHVLEGEEWAWRRQKTRKKRAPVQRKR